MSQKPPTRAMRENPDLDQLKRNGPVLTPVPPAPWCSPYFFKKPSRSDFSSEYSSFSAGIG